MKKKNSIIEPKRRLPYNFSLHEKAKELRKSMTKHEKYLWYEFLAKHQLRFQKQRIIGNYIVDFYCASARLAIEVDGGVHTATEQITYDEERTKALSQYGIKILRFFNDDIDRDPEAVFDRINEVIKSSPRK